MNNLFNNPEKITQFFIKKTEFIKITFKNEFHAMPALVQAFNFFAVISWYFILLIDLTC